MHTLPRRAWRLLPLGLWLASSLSVPAFALGIAPAPQEQEARSQDAQSRAIALIKAGDFEPARALLDDLLLNDYLDRAASLTAEGDPALALTLIDRALDLAPKHLPSLLAKAETSLQLAQDGISRGAPSSLITGSMRDAFEHFIKASKQDSRATFGAVRAANLLGETESALQWARSGRQLLLQDTENYERYNALNPTPQQTLAQAFYRAYTEAKAEQQAAEAELDPEAEDAQVDPALVEAAAARFVEAEDALGNLLGRDSHEPYVWSTLSDLYVWEGRFDLALQRLQQGLKRLPGNSDLLSRFSRIGHQAVGREASLAIVEEIAAQSPEDTVSQYYLGLERFEYGLELFAAADYRGELFRQVEDDFRRSRELYEPNTELCLAYELVARSARGWCAYYGAEDLEQASQVFHSMNELKPGGISYALPGRMRSGIDGLAFIGDSYNQREDNLNAAIAFEAAHHADPTDGRWANNAGFFLRDAAVEAEMLGKDLCAVARGEKQDPELLASLRERLGVGADEPRSDEPQWFHQVAREKLKQSRELIWRSWLAYEKAAEIYPDDVRIVNDAALVLVYYDHRKLDVAEELLKRSRDLGAEQVPAMRAEIDAAELDEAELATREIELRDLTEAWGDAYQNLGVLEWVHRKNAEAALAYLERSVEIGPDPRPDLSNNLIPIVRGEREALAGNYFDLIDWGHPCDQN